MSQVILTYDLHGAKSEVYKKVDAELVSKDYRKAFTDTTWEETFNDTVTPDGALRTTLTEFAECAASAGAAKYSLKVYAAPKEATASVIFPKPQTAK
jgi:hypothetical protein